MWTIWFLFTSVTKPVKLSGAKACAMVLYSLWGYQQVETLKPNFVNNLGVHENTKESFVFTFKDIDPFESSIQDILFMKNVRCVLYFNYYYPNIKFWFFLPSVVHRFLPKKCNCSNLYRNWHQINQSSPPRKPSLV